MVKHPFMDCKSRKRRKRPAAPPKPKYKGYCPRSMIRYDWSVSIPTPAWVCKLCLKCLLSEKAVREHLLTCNNKKMKQKEQKSIFNNITEKVRYKCRYCIKNFSRQVVLRKHEEVHEKPKVKQEWESESDSETETDKKPVPVFTGKIEYE